MRERISASSFDAGGVAGVRFPAGTTASTGVASPHCISWAKTGDVEIVEPVPVSLLHVRDGNGLMRIGVDAHLTLWGELPGFRWLAWPLARQPRLLHGLTLFYLAFTRRRPGLVRRQRSKARAHG